MRPGDDMVNDMVEDVADEMVDDITTLDSRGSAPVSAPRGASASASVTAPITPAVPPNERSQRFAALYAELHRIARREARRYGQAAMLGTTTLLHEAYLQLAERKSLDTSDDRRFLAYTARAMRGLVIDRLRALGSAKRGGAFEIGPLDTFTAEQLAALPADASLEEVSAALDDLAALDAELALLVDLRFFCGFTMAEIAAQRGVTERTVQRQWEKARAWLFMALKAA
jgi:RNA polymerase sigma factor (TIGR02999 family)